MNIEMNAEAGSYGLLSSDEAYATEETVTDEAVPGKDSWGAVSDLDAFFASFYAYYQARGLPTILASGVVNLLTLGFTGLFSTFLFLYVDWVLLLNTCVDEDSCKEFAHYVTAHPFAIPSFYHGAR